MHMNLWYFTCVLGLLFNSAALTAAFFGPLSTPVQGPQYSATELETFGLPVTPQVTSSHHFSLSLSVSFALPLALSYLLTN